MSAPIRVLVVDDSVVVRRLVADAIGAEDGIEVAGVASNGRLALARIEASRPDVVTLDIEMPEMDGLEALAAIRERWPDLPVIMCSTLTQRGAMATLEALSLGASDYVTKPTGEQGIDAAKARVRADIVPKIKALCRRPSSPRVGGAAPPVRRRPARAAAVEAVAIGVSTGGPNALRAMLPELGADLPVPVLVVQHMPPVFTRLLAERLDAACPFPVVEAESGMPVVAGTAYIAPGGLHLEVVRKGAGIVVATNENPPESSCRPAVDPMLRSAAATWGSGVLAVVMTGMGHDGLRGSEVVVDAGGSVIAQDEASSVVWGMPAAVVDAGLAEDVVPLDELAAAIRRRLARRRVGAAR